MPNALPDPHELATMVERANRAAAEEYGIGELTDTLGMLAWALRESHVTDWGIALGDKPAPKVLIIPLDRWNVPSPHDSW